MSNIFTSFLRVIPRAGRSIGRGEAEWIVGRVLNTRGSYNVPVTARLADGGSLLDIQAGPGNNPDFHDFWDDHHDRYACMWERFFNEGGSQDDITYYGQDGRTGYGAFWYGFDEVRVVGAVDHLPDLGGSPALWKPDGDGAWRAGVAGRHQTGNDRTDVEVAGPCSMEVEWNPPVTDVASGGLATPTSPAYYDAEMVRLEPEGLRRLVVQDSPYSAGDPGVERVELLWRGRVVRRARREYDVWLGEDFWEQRSADDWDNCLSPDYLASMRKHGVASLPEGGA